MSTRIARRGGFTLIEALIATALVGFSLVVMFGFHNQAVRSNMHARKMTDCTYLAQRQLELLLSLPWTSASTPIDLEDILGPDPTIGGGGEWAWLEHPNDGSQPQPINASGDTDIEKGPLMYNVTWDVEDMDADETWVRLRVRCQYEDETFNTWRGTTVSSYRFRDS